MLDFASQHTNQGGTSTNVPVFGTENRNSISKAASTARAMGMLITAMMNNPHSPCGHRPLVPRQMPALQATQSATSMPSPNSRSAHTSSASFSYPGTPPPMSTPYYPGHIFAPQEGGALHYHEPASSTQGPYSRAPSVSAGSIVGSVGSARQTSVSDPIQVLTINTSQGSYCVPVEVHQASRLANEKRARNAVASARFRQRRKEKERESSTTIEKMQHQTRDLERRIREVEQERDFYRGERDRIRDVLNRTPDMRHLAMQGPPSPQTLRSGSQSQAPPAPTDLASQDTALSGRAPRRRTRPSGEFTNVAYALPVHPGYPGQRTITLPPLWMEATTAPPTTGANIPTSALRSF